MKKTIQHIFLLLFLGQFLGTVSMAQDYGHSAPHEAIDFFTDRSIYISGENICFSAIIMTDISPGEKALSKVLYVELINQKSDQILGQKFLVFNAVSTGYIKIPLNLSTGIYYLKSYTKYMRNFGPGTFTYLKIKVLNPFEGATQATDSTRNDQQKISSFQTISCENHLFRLETDREVYGPSDSIIITINPNIQRDSLLSACISVVPSHTSHPEFLVNGSTNHGNDLVYLPEYKGISLTGFLMDDYTKRPLPSRQLELSILEDRFDFISVYSDSAGRFFFPLPERLGQKTVFIGTTGADSIMPSILVDNDFSILSIDLPNEPFMLSEGEKLAALKLARNQQIYQQYLAGGEPSEQNIENTGEPTFYGIPTQTLNIDDYVQLPTLEDYFNELPYLVKVRKIRGEKYLKVLGSSPTIQIYEPLVMMDMIALYDIDAILSVSSNNISHIDIINEPYVKGNITYGGIISIFSKNNDYAGLDLPRGGIFISYNFLSGTKPVINDTGDDHTPDARNTLYWNGNLSFRDEATKEITFMSGHSLGEYDIVLQGVMKSGKRFLQMISFDVE
jgi:hypothetical protein